MVVVFLFLPIQMCWNTYFYTFLNINQNLAKNGPKNDNFSHFAKHRCIKKRFVATPLFQKLELSFLLIFFLKAKTLMLNKNTNQNQEKAKTRKRHLKEKTKQGTKQRERMDKNKTLQFKSFMLFFSWNKTKEENKWNKETKRNKKKAKKERQEGRKKENNERERERERER